MEQINKLKSTLPKEAVRESVIAKGLLIGTESARISISEHRSIETISATKTISVPSNVNKVVIFLGSWTIHFGKEKLEHHKLGQLTIDYGIESFIDDKLKTKVNVSLSDKLGDQKWGGVFELVVMMFG